MTAENLGNTVQADVEVYSGTNGRAVLVKDSFFNTYFDPSGSGFGANSKFFVIFPGTYLQFINFMCVWEDRTLIWFTFLKLHLQTKQQIIGNFNILS